MKKYFRGNRFYFTIAAFFLILHGFFILLSFANMFVPAEIYFYSWLVHKGLVPVKDFFENHSILLYYMLAPLSAGKTLVYFKAFYVAIVTVNLVFMMVILRKQSTKLGFFLGTWFYLASVYALFYYRIWYESMITTCFLAIYFILTETNIRYKTVILSILAAIAASIKSVAAVILFPVMLFTGSILVIIPTVLIWGSVLFYFSTQHALHDFINGFIFFNTAIVKLNPREPLKNFLFLIYPVGMIIFGLVIIKKVRLRKLFISFLFFLCSLAFVINSTDRAHFFPLVAFFVIFISNMFLLLRNNSLTKKLFITCFFIYCICLLNSVLPFSLHLHRKYPQIRLEKTKPPYPPDPGERIALSLQKKIGNESIIVLWGDYALEVYYYLDRLPPTYYPIKYQFLERVVNDFDTRTRTGMKKNHTAFILFEKPFDRSFLPFPSLWKYIDSNYVRIASNADYFLYEKK